MMFKKYKFIPLLIVLNSCSFLFNNDYNGLATTTLAGHIILSDTSCYVATAVNENAAATEVIFNIVINLVTLGDKTVTACVTENNYSNLWEAPSPVEKPEWFDPSVGIVFYASDNVVAPGESSVGDASEILLYGYNIANNYTSNFPFSSFDVGSKPLCSAIDLSFSGFMFAELDLTVLHKKPYIVARVPLCGNLPIGTASNPLYSEKNLMKE